MGVTASAVASALFPNDLKEVDRTVAESNKKREQYLAQQENQRQTLEQREAQEGLQEGHDASQLLAWLYLGDRFASRDEESLKRRRIGFVLQLSNVHTPDSVLERYRKLGIIYLR